MERAQGLAAAAGDVRRAPFADMVWIPTQTFRMGSDRHYPEERPAHLVSVDGFWIDRYPVTNARFARFVEATGHVTFAEKAPDPAQYPNALPEMLYAGSLVFARPAAPVDLRDFRNWWTYLRAADWRHPTGHASSIDGLEQHPVVHVTFGDAEAFATWGGKSLPTEAEWELAARGGLEDADFAWGDEPFPGGRLMANTWQGEFPWQNLLADGYEGTSPIGAFPPNGYGLLDVTGNVWEWTSDFFTAGEPTKACCAPRQPGDPIPRRVIKGGSHLCAPNYCLRYRPAARQAEAVDTSTQHIGFRCIARDFIPNG
jgi:formylglycine-generating enzyme